jgi:cytochrome c
MHYSLKLALGLIVLCVIAGIASVAGIYGQDFRQDRVTAEALTGGKVAAGRVAMTRFGCGACHQIPGVSGAEGRVGPSLAGFATRTTIAGVLGNDPASLQRWLRHPQQVVPGNGMPDQGITDAEGRDLSAYLYTLKR